MKSRAMVKENIPAHPRTPSNRNRQSATATAMSNPDFDTLFGSPTPSEHEGTSRMMLSPPPEETSKYTRRPVRKISNLSISFMTLDLCLYHNLSLSYPNFFFIISIILIIFSFKYLAHANLVADPRTKPCFQTSCKYYSSEPAIP